MLEIVALGNKIVKLDRANYWGCLGDSAGKESACNAADLGSIPWVGKIPLKRGWLPTPVFWPGESHELYSPCGCQELDMTERHSLSLRLSNEILHSRKQT